METGQILINHFNKTILITFVVAFLLAINSFQCFVINNRLGFKFNTNYNILIFLKKKKGGQPFLLYFVLFHGPKTCAKNY